MVCAETWYKCRLEDPFPEGDGTCENTATVWIAGPLVTVESEWSFAQFQRHLN